MTQHFKMRASSVATLFDCAHRWEWEQLLKRARPSSMRPFLGNAIHAGTAAFDLARMNGHDAFTVDDAADVMLDYLRNPEFEVNYTGDDLRIKDAEKIGLVLIIKYCREISPLFDFIDVERTLTPMEIDCGGGVTVTLTGQMDRSRVIAPTESKNRKIFDLKTGRRAISQGVVSMRPHMAQLGTYQVMDQADNGVETDGAAIIALSTSSKPEAAISPVIDCRRMMVGVEETIDAPEQKGLIHYAAEMFRTGSFPPNNKSGLCSQRWCSRWDNCIFHE